jgi:hypothetical protein
VHLDSLLRDPLIVRSPDGPHAAALVSRESIPEDRRGVKAARPRALLARASALLFLLRLNTFRDRAME